MYRINQDCDDLETTRYTSRSNMNYQRLSLGKWWKYWTVICKVISRIFFLYSYLRIPCSNWHGIYLQYFANIINFKSTISLWIFHVDLWVIIQEKYIKNTNDSCCPGFTKIFPCKSMRGVNLWRNKRHCCHRSAFVFLPQLYQTYSSLYVLCIYSSGDEMVLYLYPK